jgi:hypothetical protein
MTKTLITFTPAPKWQLTGIGLRSMYVRCCWFEGRLGLAILSFPLTEKYWNYVEFYICRMSVVKKINNHVIQFVINSCLIPNYINGSLITGDLICLWNIAQNVAQPRILPKLIPNYINGSLRQGDLMCLWTNGSKCSSTEYFAKINT